MRRALSFLAIALAVASPCDAQNLLTNPDFDTDVAGWISDVDWIAGSFDAEDHAGALDSGSARVVNTRDVAGSNGFFQCVTIPEADGTVPYEGSVRSRVADGESVDGATILGLWFFANDTCDFSGLVLDAVFPSNGLEVWQEIGVHDAVYPAGTRSIRFDLRIDKFADGAGSVAGLFDRAYLPEPSGIASAFAAWLALAALQRRD